MTKSEAIFEFRGEALPAVQAEEQDGRPNYPKRCEAWSLFLNALKADKRISAHQVRSWGQPKCCQP